MHISRDIKIPQSSCHVSWFRQMNSILKKKSQELQLPWKIENVSWIRTTLFKSWMIEGKISVVFLTSWEQTCLKAHKALWFVNGYFPAQSKPNRSSCWKFDAIQVLKKQTETFFFLHVWLSGFFSPHFFSWKKSLMLYMSFSFWLLGVESSDFSHAETETTVCNAKRIHKTTTI